MDDIAIIELFLARDESAIAMTAEKYGRSLRSIARSVVRDEREAEECENDTYLKAWNSIPPNEPREHFFAYLGAITRRLALNCVRDSGRLRRGATVVELTKEMEECIPDIGEASERAELNELKAELNGYLAGVSERKRSVFIRRYWYFEEIRTIARELKCSESSVKTTLLRMRRELKAILIEKGYSFDERG